MTLNIVEKSKEKYLEYKRRHQDILDAAIRVFNSKGYSLAKITEIAQKAGVSAPAMYKHFTNKKDLFLACFHSIYDQLLSDYRAVYKKTPDNEIGYIEGVIEGYIDFVLNAPHKSMFLVHMLSYKDDPEIADVFNAFMERSIEGARRILESAKRKGELRSKLDVRLLACVFVNQYFTVVASREFVDAKYFSSNTYFQLMRDLLGIE